MSAGNGEGRIVSPHTGEAVFVNPVPTAADCAKNFLEKPAADIVAACLIGILGQLELISGLVEREQKRHEQGPE